MIFTIISPTSCILAATFVTSAMISTGSIIPLVQKQLARMPALRQQSRNLAFVTVGDQSGFNKLESSGGKKIFYFTATWCPPCRMIAPIFEKLAKEHAGVDFCKVDVDALPEAAGKYRVSGVPTFSFLNNSKMVAEFSGADEKKLRQSIHDLEALA